MTRISRQKGVALMMVLMVFALVSILAVGIQSRQALFIQKAGNHGALTQAYQYSRAAEALGRVYLHQDWKNGKDDNKLLDDLSELETANTNLALYGPTIGYQGSVQDVQGKFNLNDLLTIQGTANKEMQTRFKRILDRLSIDSITVQKVVDWMDEDSESEGVDGAEDGEYLGLETPYRSAGQLFNDISEVKLLFEVTEEDFETLLPYITVLPTGRGHINVNTASDVVLQSLVEGLDDSQATELAESRKDNGDPWESIQEFQESLKAAGVNQALKTKMLGVRSDFYDLFGKVTFADRVINVRTLAYRNNDDGMITIVKRDLGQYYKPPAPTNAEAVAGDS